MHASRTSVRACRRKFVARQLILPALDMRCNSLYFIPPGKVPGSPPQASFPNMSCSGMCLLANGPQSGPGQEAEGRQGGGNGGGRRACTEPRKTKTAERWAVMGPYMRRRRCKRGRRRPGGGGRRGWWRRLARRGGRS